MIRFYTAVGRFNNTDGDKIPKVVQGGKNHVMDAPEFILWSSVLWNIYNYDELRKVFEYRIKEAKIKLDFNFDYYLELLISRNLIAAGQGDTGVDAIYSMLSKLYICPVNCTFLQKIAVFTKLLLKGMPLGILVHLFDKDKIETDDEEKIWSITNQTILTVPEAMWCVLNGVEKISGNNMVQRIYGEKYNDRTIGSYAQMHDNNHKVISAITNLYLKKMLIWDIQ